MAWAVKFDKPDFIGKASLEHRRAAGLGQKLVGFEMDGPAGYPLGAVPEEGAPILRDDGFPVGRVTSARYSPALHRAIGLAWVPVASSDEGATLRIAINGGAESARVVKLPFYDPAGARMRS